MMHPKDLIDRDAERELFRTLVAYQSRARILTICDRGGRGKSSLLRRLRYNCQYEIKPPVPSCLLELDSLSPEPFAFASSLTQGFALRGEDVRKRFAKFNPLDGARTAKDFTPFDDGSSTRWSRNARVMAMASASAVQEGGKNIGVNVEQAGTVQLPPLPEFTEDQEQRARERCIEALFDDLRTVCATQPMVLLLDGWERCIVSLRDWIFDELLGNHVLHPDMNLRPDKLLVVIAGRPYKPGEDVHGLRIDEFRPLFDSDQDFSATVLSIKSLSEWDTQHIREFMALNGCPEPTEAEVNVIREKLSRGMSLEKIVTLIDEYFRS
jgi:hypothetical protein